MLIAQISDLHLKPKGVLAYGAADTATALKRTVAHLRALTPQPDVILATGDMADEGADDSYDLLARLLAPLKAPIYAVPGNHDRKTRLLEVFAETRTALETSDAPAGFICYIVEHGPLRLVAVDTVTPGEHGGGLDEDRLAWLDTALSRRPDTPTVVFMHHPPFASAIGHMDVEIFTGRRRLAAMLSRHPQVERLLCGHLHRPVARRFGGCVAMVSPGVGMQLVLDLRPDAPSAFVMEPPAIMLHHWTDPWGHDPALVSHVSIVPERPGQYGGPHPFTNVVSPI